MRKVSGLLIVAAVTVGAAPAAELPSAAASLGGEPAHESAGADVSKHAPARSSGAPAAKLPGFAAELAEMPAITGPGAWKPIAHEKAWSALARSTPASRQAMRWRYARSLIGQDSGSAALGVLDVMRADDPDLTLVPAWQLARGAALTQMGRAGDALAALNASALANNPEACLWRMRAMSDAGLGQAALAQVNCARHAISARPASIRARFIVAAARAAIEAGRPALGLKWLGMIPDDDPAANLYRGKAHLALGEAQAGRLRLDRVAISGNAEQRMDAKLAALEDAVARRSVPPADALKQLDHIRFTWRGGPIEERALRLSWQLGDGEHDLRRSLAAGATLFRHFDLGKDTGPVLSKLQAQLATALAPGSAMPIGEAAGLYWDFRDLAPGGAEGDLLVNRLAGRLQAAGLYARAAELLRYQLTERVRDIAQGPLSVKVASLYILAGRPDQAIRALLETSRNPYPDEMLWDRRRVEAAALYQLGKANEALAVLQDVPDGDSLRAEIYWKKQDWPALAAVGEPALPRAGALTEVAQAKVLRHAIALAMLGREDGLASLRSRYGSSFATLPSAPVFDVLTRSVGALDAAAVGKAMTAIPTASPAGRIGNLLDVERTEVSGA